MKQQTQTKQSPLPDEKIENELQALVNALENLNLKGYSVHHFPGRGRKYFLCDNNGTSLTGCWDYTKLNHFIMGYGKAFNKFKS